jgi:hypothetical protein
MSTVNWESALGGDWSDGANWELGLVPASSDDVQVALLGTYTVSITSHVSASDLTINATGGTLIESGAGSLTLSGDLSLYNGAVFLNGANSIGAVQLTGGLLAVGNGGALGNSTVLFSGGALLGTTTEALGASLAFDGTPTIAAATGQTLSLEGGEVLDGFGPSTLTFGAPGEAGTVLWEPTNFQLLSTSPESLDIRAEELVFGNFDLGLTALSSAWNSVDIEAGATLDLAGVPSSFSTLAGSGTLTGSTTSFVTIGGGYFSGNLSDYLDLDITGNVHLAGDSTIGSIEIGNGGSLAALTNNPGGFIDLDTRSGISLAPGASNAFFVNDGKLLQSGPVGASVVSVPFVNDGTMRIASGSVTFTDGFFNAGTVEGRLTTTNNGTTTSTTWTANPAESDFTGGGVSDVLLTNSSGSVVDWSMSGSTITSSNHLIYQGQNVSLASQFTIAGLGDLSGDGKADILLSDSNGTFYDWTMDGPTATSSNEVTYQNQPVELAPSSGWTIAGLGDFNGDGKADVLFGNTNGTFVDWTMNGPTIEQAGHLTYQGNTVDLGPAWSVAGIGDFNGDNKSDILLRNTNGTLADWSMNRSIIDSSQHVTYQGALVTLPSSWSIIGVGDFNGDGMADILLRNTNGSLREWLMNGSQIESSQAITDRGASVSLASSWTLAAVGDFNGDGMADLLWRNSSGALVEWTMNGAAITSASSIAYQGQAVNPSGWLIHAQPTDLVFG